MKLIGLLLTGCSARSPSQALEGQTPMHFRKLFALLTFAGSQSLAQVPSAVSDHELLDPPEQDWLMWRGDYQSSGFSALNQIHSGNVSQLQEAWNVSLERGPNNPAPIVNDGVMYLLGAMDTLIAMDATSGRELWRYAHQNQEGVAATSKISVALHDDRVLVPTTDLHMVALDGKSGEVIWDRAIEVTFADRSSYQLRGSPMIAEGVIVQGVTATMVPGGGFIVGLDLETGEEKWRFQTVAHPGEQGGHTWNDLPWEQRSGGSVWMPGSYDAELGLVYYGLAPTYNTAPLLEAVDIPSVTNDALYTNATVALRPSTGELVWYYQHVANDQLDLDWTYERHIVELDVSGESKKVVLTAGKIALYDALDAATGQYLFSIDLGLQNIVTAIDPATGAKTLHPGATPNGEDTHFLCPFMAGGRNWPSGSLNEESKTLFLPLAEMCMNAGPTGTTSVLSTGMAAQVTPSPQAELDGNFGRLQAFNVETGEMLWDFRSVAPPTSAVLATAGDLVFVGALDESFRAVDAKTGELLWETQLGDIPTSYPTTYSVDGKQYVAVATGTPTVHANVWLGAIFSFNQGAEDSRYTAMQRNLVSRLERNGPQLKVYALP